MDRQVVLVFLALASCPTLGYGQSAAVARDHGSDTPRILFRSEEGSKYPAFVSADAVLTEDGKVNASLFSPAAVDRMTSLLATAPQGDCIRAENYYESYVNPPPRSTIGAAVRSAHLVLLGTVVESTFGFSGAAPGQLLHVRPDQILKGTAGGDLYFVFVPIGNFSVGATRLCKTDTRYASPPEIREQLMAFVPRFWNSDHAGAFLRTFDEAGIITIRADSTLSLPGRYRKAEAAKAAAMPTRKAELLELVRSLSQRFSWKSTHGRGI